ncbi:MAG: CBS domain-containing protein [Candidatus Methylomirabilales bacterium]
MLARDLMTTEVITATPQTSVEALTRLLLDSGVSAVPVVGAGGEVLGVVSEADLVHRLRSPSRKKWWLAFLADRVELASEFARIHGRRVEDLMHQPAVTVTEETPVEEIARILEEHRIKRVPVVRDGRLVGIVSRRDLVRALAMRPAAAPAEVLPNDMEIERRVSEELRRTKWLGYPSVQVRVADGIVSLEGFVDHAEVRRALRVLVENTTGVRGVEDHLQIRRYIPTTGA